MFAREAAVGGVFGSGARPNGDADLVFAAPLGQPRVRVGDRRDRRMALGCGGDLLPDFGGDLVEHVERHVLGQRREASLHLPAHGVADRAPVGLGRHDEPERHPQAGRCQRSEPVALPADEGSGRLAGVELNN